MKRRNLGSDKQRQIKIVVYVENLPVVEQALRATGRRNRGEALTEICQAYLDKQAEAFDKLEEDMP